jgi:hypothetical protein
MLETEKVPYEINFNYVIFIAELPEGIKIILGY